MTMTRPATTLAMCTLGFLLLPFTLGAAQPLLSLQEPDHGHEEEHEDEGPLAEAMESIKDNMRALRKSLGDPARDGESVHHAQGMMKSALEALKYVPEAPEHMSGADVVQWRVDFQRKMLSVCDHLLQVELALAQGRHEDAKMLYRAIGDLKKEGHDTYDPDEE
ncbi:MAG: hypothetical protein ACYTEP_06690 [Planctomycetota bacterium]|jgi:hypothetical protein